MTRGEDEKTHPGGHCTNYPEGKMASQMKNDTRKLATTAGKQTPTNLARIARLTENSA